MSVIWNTKKIMWSCGWVLCFVGVFFCCLFFHFVVLFCFSFHLEEMIVLILSVLSTSNTKWDTCSSLPGSEHSAREKDTELQSKCPRLNIPQISFLLEALWLIHLRSKQKMTPKMKRWYNLEGNSFGIFAIRTFKWRHIICKIHY